MSTIQQQAERQIDFVAITSLATAIVAIAWIAIFFRLLEREIGPFATAFHRVWLATFLLGIWNGYKVLQAQFSLEKVSHPTPYTGWIMLQLAAAGVFFAGDQLLWAWSLTKTSVASSALLTNLSPLWTTLLGWLLWQQNFDKRFLIGMGIAIIGTGIIGLEDLQIAAVNLEGDSVSVLASISFSLYLLIVEKLRETLSARAILLWSSLFSTLLILPIVLTMEDQLFPTSWQSWALIIALGLICQILGQGLINYSLKRFSSGFVAVILLLSPIITAVFAWIIFSESLNLLSGVAFAGILLGIYLTQSSASAVKE